MNYIVTCPCEECEDIRRKIFRVLGVALIALPFVAIFIGAVIDLGWAAALVIHGIIAGMVGATIGGFWLWNKGSRKDR